MSMTKAEKATRKALAMYMYKQGYPSYADLFYKFDLNFHRPRYPFAAMVDSDKGIIYINPTITDKEDLSVLIRHEILHKYLAHQERELKHYAKQRGLSWEQIDDIPLEDLVNMDEKDFAELSAELQPSAKNNRDIARGLYGTSYKGMPYHNVIADAEISNRGYTDADKEIVKNLKINGVPFPGIVTEIDFPQWDGMSVEEMMDAVEDEIEKDKKRAEEDTKNKRIRGKMVNGVFITNDGKRLGKKR